MKGLVVMWLWIVLVGVVLCMIVGGWLIDGIGLVVWGFVWLV